MPSSEFQFDSEYLRSWRDLRRREVLFWLVVLSYVPGILLIIWIVNEIRDDVPEHMFAFLSAAWIAAFVAAAAYRQRFRCPRCGQLLFRRLIGFGPDSPKCLSCRLPRWASNRRQPGVTSEENLHHELPWAGEGSSACWVLRHPRFHGDANSDFDQERLTDKPPRLFR